MATEFSLSISVNFESLMAMSAFQLLYNAMCYIFSVAVPPSHATDIRAELLPFPSSCLGDFLSAMKAAKNSVFILIPTAERFNSVFGYIHLFGNSSVAKTFSPKLHHRLLFNLRHDKHLLLYSHGREQNLTVLVKTKKLPRFPFMGNPGRIKSML